MTGGEVGDQLILRAVRILVLIYHHVLELGGVTEPDMLGLSNSSTERSSRSSKSSALLERRTSTYCVKTLARSSS